MNTHNGGIEVIYSKNLGIWSILLINYFSYNYIDTHKKHFSIPTMRDPRTILGTKNLTTYKIEKQKQTNKNPAFIELTLGST